MATLHAFLLVAVHEAEHCGLLGSSYESWRFAHPCGVLIPAQHSSQADDVLDEGMRLPIHGEGSTLRSPQGRRPTGCKSVRRGGKHSVCL